MADELTAKGIQFQAVEPRSSVRDRFRREHVDSKLGGINRFTTVADVIDHFLGEPSPPQMRSNPRFRSTDYFATKERSLRRFYPWLIGSWKPGTNCRSRAVFLIIRSLETAAEVTRPIVPME